MSNQLPKPFWERPTDGSPPRPGVSVAELDAWEARQQLSFPPLLREPYLQQNGGLLASGPIALRPLEELRCPAAAFWEHLKDYYYDATKATSVMVLACRDDVYYMLDCSPNVAPMVRMIVVTATNQVSHLLEASWPLEEFLAAPHTLTNEPPFTWDEVATLDRVLLHERDKTSPHGDSEQIIGLRGSVCVEYQRGQSGLRRTEHPQLPNPYHASFHRYVGRDTSAWTMFANFAQGQEVHEVSTRRHANGQWEVVHLSLSYRGILYFYVRDKQRFDALLDGLYGPALMRRVRRWKRLEYAAMCLYAACVFVVGVPIVLLVLSVRFVWRGVTYPFRAFGNYLRPRPSRPDNE